MKKWFRQLRLDYKVLLGNSASAVLLVVTAAWVWVLFDRLAALLPASGALPNQDRLAATAELLRGTIRNGLTPPRGTFPPPLNRLPRVPVIRRRPSRRPPLPSRRLIP
jgi:hypothetical protein